jgi:GT2 family glycosyltransferase
MTMGVSTSEGASRGRTDERSRAVPVSQPVGEGNAAARIGVVVIGRDEGERLLSALRAVAPSGLPTVYADSGSKDGSPERARAEGVTVVSIGEPPFTAARGRNEGARRLRESHPGLEYVQFVDGDTALDSGWLTRAARALDSDPSVAAVCGHLLERNAQTSVYRRLMQIDWAGPVGEIAACGGNAMYRLSAFERAGGFRSALEAGEELDLCGRLVAAGGRVLRIDAPMGVHDSGIETFAAWWRRSERVGRAFATLLDDPLSQHVARAARAIRAAVIWGVLLPCAFVAGVAGAALFTPLAVLPGTIILLYLVQFLHIRSRAIARGMTAEDAALYSGSCAVSKFAYAQAWLRYRIGRRSR